MNKVYGYLASVVVTYVVGVVFVGQFNLARISAMGHQIGFDDRVRTVLHDWVGMASAYLPLIAVALLIAFLFTGLLLSRFIDRSAFLYALAGFVGIVALHQIMYLVIGMTGIAATRTGLGLVAQGLAGALGGYFFFRFSNVKTSA